MSDWPINGSEITYPFSHSGGRQRADEDGAQGWRQKNDQDVTTEVKRREAEEGLDLIRHSKGGEEENGIPLESLPRRNGRLQLRQEHKGSNQRRWGGARLGWSRVRLRSQSGKEI